MGFWRSFVRFFRTPSAKGRLIFSKRDVSLNPKHKILDKELKLELELTGSQMTIVRNIEKRIKGGIIEEEKGIKIERGLFRTIKRIEKLLARAKTHILILEECAGGSLTEDQQESIQKSAKLTQKDIDRLTHDILTVEKLYGELLQEKAIDEERLKPLGTWIDNVKKKHDMLAEYVYNNIK